MQQSQPIKIHKLVDNEFRTSIDSWLTPYFKQLSNGYLLRNVGVVVNANELYAFLPKNVDKNLVGNKEISKVIQLLVHFRRLTPSGDSSNKIDIIESNLFTVVDWLIEDFRQNGLYQRNDRRVSRQQTGRILWPKTIAHVQPWLQNGNPVYVEFIKMSHEDKEDVLSYMHGTVMQRVSEKFGKIFSNFKFTYHGRAWRMKDSEMLTSLYAYRRSVNNEHTKLLVKSLILFLRPDTSRRVLGITTEEFHNVWEKMISTVYQDQEDLYRYIAKDRWNIAIQNSPITGANDQIPDTLVKDGPHNSLRILDAKYYDFTSVINATRQHKKVVPLDWYSVVKQYFYDFSFDYSKANLLRGDNWFIFPAWKANYQDNNSSNLLRRIGDVRITLPNIPNDRVVQVGMIPVFSLIDAYLSGKKLFSNGSVLEFRTET